MDNNVETSQRLISRGHITYMTGAEVAHSGKTSPVCTLYVRWDAADSRLSSRSRHEIWFGFEISINNTPPQGAP